MKVEELIQKFAKRVKGCTEKITEERELNPSH